MRSGHMWITEIGKKRKIQAILRIQNILNIHDLLIGIKDKRGVWVDGDTITQGRAQGQGQAVLLEKKKSLFSRSKGHHHGWKDRWPPVSLFWVELKLLQNLSSIPAPLFSTTQQPLDTCFHRSLTSSKCPGCTSILSLRSPLSTNQKTSSS